MLKWSKKMKTNKNPKKQKQKQQQNKAKNKNKQKRHTALFSQESLFRRVVWFYLI